MITIANGTTRRGKLPRMRNIEYIETNTAWPQREKYRGHFEYIREAITRQLVFNEEMNEFENFLIDNYPEHGIAPYSATSPFIVMPDYLQFTKLYNDSSSNDAWHRRYNLHFFLFVGHLLSTITDTSYRDQFVVGDSSTEESKLSNFFVPAFAQLLLSRFGPRHITIPANCLLAFTYRITVNKIHTEPNSVVFQDEIREVVSTLFAFTRNTGPEYKFPTQTVERYLTVMNMVSSERELRVAFANNETSQRERIRQEIVQKRTIDIFEDNYTIMLSDDHDNVTTSRSDHDDIYTYVTNIVTIAESEQLATCTNTILSVYQKVVAETIRPRGPIKKLIVAHRVGAGKTRSMVSIFNNYDKDPRVRLLLFPTVPLLTQFFDDSRGIGTNNSFADYIQKVGGTSTDLMNHLKNGISCLHEGPFDRFMYSGVVEEVTTEGGGICFQKNPSSGDNKLRAPVVAMTYADLSTLCDIERVREEGTHRNYTGLFQWGKTDMERKHTSHNNMLDNMIILMDEVHEGLEKGYGLVELLEAAKHSVIVGFTGTIPVELDDEFTNVFGKSEVGGIAKTLKGRVHYFNGQNNNMFFKHSRIEGTVLSAPHVERRKEYRKQESVIDSDLYDDGELTIAPLYTTFNSMTLRKLKRMMKLTNFQGDIYEGMKEFTPLVSGLLNDVRKHILDTNDDSETKNHGLMIMTNREAGMDLIMDILAEEWNLGYFHVTGQSCDPELRIMNIEAGEKKLTTLKVGGVPKLITDMWNDVITKQRIFVIDTNVVKTGLNILRVSHVFCNSYFETYSDMVQTYGRADRRCSPQSLTGRMEVGEFRELVKRQYTLKKDKNDVHSVTVYDTFEKHAKDYIEAENREVTLQKYSIQRERK
jgi:hypothetical protein